jgi:hypothetical protein
VNQENFRLSGSVSATFPFPVCTVWKLSNFWDFFHLAGFNIEFRTIKINRKMENLQKVTELLERLRQAVRVRNYSYRTEQAYLYWVEKFLRYYHHKHPLKWAAMRSAATSITWR